MLSLCPSSLSSLNRTDLLFVLVCPRATAFLFCPSFLMVFLDSTCSRSPKVPNSAVGTIARGTMRCCLGFPQKTAGEGICIFFCSSDSAWRRSIAFSSCAWLGLEGDYDWDASASRGEHFRLDSSWRLKGNGRSSLNFPSRPIGRILTYYGVDDLGAGRQVNLTGFTGELQLVVLVVDPPRLVVIQLPLFCRSSLLGLSWGLCPQPMGFPSPMGCPQPMGCTQLMGCGCSALLWLRGTS